MKVFIQWDKKAWKLPHKQLGNNMARMTDSLPLSSPINKIKFTPSLKSPVRFSMVMSIFDKWELTNFIRFVWTYSIFSSGASISESKPSFMLVFLNRKTLQFTYYEAWLKFFLRGTYDIRLIFFAVVVKLPSAFLSFWITFTSREFGKSNAIFPIGLKWWIKANKICTLDKIFFSNTLSTFHLKIHANT